MSIWLLIIVALALVWILSKTTLVVPEGSVVKTFALGKAHKSYGAGFYFGWFDKALIKQIQLKIGTIATASSAETIEIEGMLIPAKFVESSVIGSSVRIDKFDGTTPIVTCHGVPNERNFDCEKCGHQNKVRV